MNIKKINLLLFIVSIVNICNTAYKTTTPQLVRKITKPKTLYKPKAFNTYKSALPLTSYKINALLSQKAPQIQNKIQNHQFFKDLIIEVNQIPKIEITQQPSIKFNEKTLLKLEIFMYCLEHPQEAEEIMNFYQEMKDANHLIKDRLEFLPPHAQEFFKQQLQKYVDSQPEYNQDIHPIKAKILKLYPYIITALSITFSVLLLTVLFYLNEFRPTIINDLLKTKQLNADDPIEKQLLEAFELLTDALNLEPIELRKHYGLPQNAGGSYSPFFKFITVSPAFLNLDFDSQIFGLLHELRHYQQQTQIVIPQDIIEYAKTCGVKEYRENKTHQEFLHQFLYFWLTGWFWNPALVEFDADLFAARQMKDYPWINTVATASRGIIFPESFDIFFNPSTGYLSSTKISKESPHGNRITFLAYIEKKWDYFINSQPNENMYLRYVPQHLKEAAEKNKALKSEKKQALQEAKQLFEE